VGGAGTAMRPSRLPFCTPREAGSRDNSGTNAAGTTLSSLASLVRRNLIFDLMN
jgi:hypothetical protein